MVIGIVKIVARDTRLTVNQYRQPIGGNMERKKKKTNVCPYCHRTLRKKFIVREAARINGAKTSERKRAAVRENGKKGGRPKKH